MKGKEIVVGLIGRIFLSILTLLIFLFFLDIPFNFSRSVNVVLILYISFHSLLLIFHLVFSDIKLPFIFTLILDVIFSLILIYSTGLIYSPFIFLLFLITFSTSSLKWRYAILLNLAIFSLFTLLCVFYNKFVSVDKPPLVDEEFWHRFQGSVSTINIVFLLSSLLFVDFLLRRLHRSFSYSSLKKTLMLSNLPMAIGFYKPDGILIEASNFFVKSQFNNDVISTLVKEMPSDVYMSGPKLTSFTRDGKNYELSIYPINYSNKKTSELMVLIKEMSNPSLNDVFNKFSLKEILHEIKNPLSVISTAVYSAKGNEDIMKIIIKEIEQIKGFIRSIEDKEYGVEKSCQFHYCFKELLDIYKYQFEEKKIVIEYFIPEGEVVQIPKNHLSHILHNVFSNIVKYSRSGSKVYVVGYIEYNIENSIRKFYLKFKNETNEKVAKVGSGLKIIQTLLENYSGKLNFYIENNTAITEISM